MRYVPFFRGIKERYRKHGGIIWSKTSKYHLTLCKCRVHESFIVYRKLAKFHVASNIVKVVIMLNLFFIKEKLKLLRPSQKIMVFIFMKNRSVSFVNFLYEFWAAFWSWHSLNFRSAFHHVKVNGDHEILSSGFFLTLSFLAIFTKVNSQCIPLFPIL